jgi:hypothetical protein
LQGNPDATLAPNSFGKKKALDSDFGMFELVEMICIAVLSSSGTKV